MDALTSTSGTEPSAFMHNDVAALSQCRSNTSNDDCLPAPCFSSSAAELVTDCDEVSTMSSRGSLKQKSKNVSQSIPEKKTAATSQQKNDK